MEYYHTDLLAEIAIDEFERVGKYLQADGVRVVHAHLNPLGFDEGINWERQRIFKELIARAQADNRSEQVEGMRRYLDNYTSWQIGNEKTRSLDK
jgi:hypothetical protein